MSATVSPRGSQEGPNISPKGIQKQNEQIAETKMRKNIKWKQETLKHLK